MTYAEQLRHPNWQRKRLEVLNLADFKCQRCGDSETTLHVHHKRYFKGRLAWEYETNELVALCEPCHQESHEEGDQLSTIVAALPQRGSGSLAEVTSLLIGYLSGFLDDEPMARVYELPVSDTYAFHAGQTIAHLSALKGWVIDDMLRLGDELIDCPTDLLAGLRRALKEARPDS